VAAAEDVSREPLNGRDKRELEGTTAEDEGREELERELEWRGAKKDRDEVEEDELMDDDKEVIDDRTNGAVIVGVEGETETTTTEEEDEEIVGDTAGTTTFE